MNKSKKRTNPKKLHISYKYIIFFCAVFATFNFFIQKLAYQNEGKNYPQVQNMRFNQVQSDKFNKVIEESKKINVKKIFQIIQLLKEKNILLLIYFQFYIKQIRIF